MNKTFLIVISAFISLCFALFAPIVSYHATLTSVIIFVFLSRLFGVVSVPASICYGSLFVIIPFLFALAGLVTNFPVAEAVVLALSSYIRSDAIEIELVHVLLGLVLSLLVSFIWPINKVKNNVPLARTPQKTRRPF
jgi:4-amino-4-deoxy-L-arabinose transferase-like glycosyltransferase